MTTQITRRSLLLSLPAFAVARKALGQAGAPPLRPRWLSHMTLNVSDVKRSMDFYQGLLGMPIQARQGATVLLRVGSGPRFIALSPVTAGVTPSISYYGLAVEDFNVDRILKILSAHGITRADGTGGGLSGGPMKVRVRMRGADAGGAKEGTAEIFFSAQDGIVVQVQDPRYAGGAGVLGDVVKIEPSPVKGLLAVSSLNHFTISAIDGPHSTQFHRDLFGFGIRAYQGPTAPAVAVGPTAEFVMFTGGGGGARGGAATPPAPPRTASINHACLGMENFNVEQIHKTFESYGLKPREGAGGAAGPMRHYTNLRLEARGGTKEGTPEVYFTDPDGLPIQLQHVSYCGGGGYLGSVCPPVA